MNSTKMAVNVGWFTNYSVDLKTIRDLNEGLHGCCLMKDWISSFFMVPR